MVRKKLLAIGAVLAGLLLPAQAMAAFEAYTRADLNLRVGPDTTYGIIDVIPYGDSVIVVGCLRGYNWCDIEWDGLRGWVAAEYLIRPGTHAYLPYWGARVGLPIISFSFGSYHDRWYRDRPWYKHRRGHWDGRDWRRRHGHDRDRDRRHGDRDRDRRHGDSNWERDQGQQDSDRKRQKRRSTRTYEPRQQVDVPQKYIDKRDDTRREVKRSKRERVLERQERPRSVERSQSKSEKKAEKRRRKLERLERATGQSTDYQTRGQ